MAFKTTPPSKLLTTSQVADRLSVTIDQVVALINLRRLRATNVSLGRKPRWRVDPADLAAFINGNTLAPAPERKRRKVLDKVTEYF